MTARLHGESNPVGLRGWRLRPGFELGYTVIEVLFTLAVVAVSAGVSVGGIRAGLDRVQARAAARYLTSRLLDARARAVRDAAAVAIQFRESAGVVSFQLYRDGNGNGIRASEMLANIDPPVADPERLEDEVGGVTFGLLGSLPSPDGAGMVDASGGPIRCGPADRLVFSPDGQGSSGTMYIRGRRSQVAVRVLGTTGRMRVLEYEPASGSWNRQ